MAGSISVTVKDNRFPNFVRQFVPANRRRLKDEADDTADDVRANIVTMGLIETRAMLESVKAEMTGRLEGEVSVSAVSEDGFPYPALQDKGGVFVPATGFFSKAVDKSRDRVGDRFDHVVEDALE